MPKQKPSKSKGTENREGAAAYRAKVAALYADSAPPDPSPWDVEPPRQLVYVQAAKRERAITQMNRINRFYDSIVVSERGGRYLDGSWGGFSWVLQLPTGETFYGHCTRGDHDGWMDLFRRFTATEQRLWAVPATEQGQVAVSDGHTVRCDDCTCRLLSEND